jgi:hypothetical protein
MAGGASAWGGGGTEGGGAGAPGVPALSSASFAPARLLSQTSDTPRSGTGSSG